MSKPTKTTAQGLPKVPELELNRIVRLPEASRLSGVSEDSLRRNYADKIIRLGPRAVGIRVGHCLHLIE
jgi:hypothetical protein